MNACENGLKDYYSNVIDSVGDGVLVLNDEGTVTLMNPAAEEITGFSRRQVQGNPFSRIFHNEKVLLEMVEKTSASGMSISDYENIALRNGGRITPISATTSPLLRANGDQIGTVIILRDLTNIRDLEGAVRQADRLAALGTLAAGLAHEIKNPLGGIKGAAQLLEREFPEESEHREYTRIVLREVERVNRIVEELLELTTPRKLRLGKVNVHRTLGDIIILQRGAVEQRKVLIQQHFDPSIPPILGDEELLHQLFLNLVKNAVEAVGETGLIRVTTRIVSDYSLTQKGERRSRMVAVDVADDGPGIPPEQLEHLFTPFYTTKPKGTGLGLVISQKIVSEHRGMMKVDSDPGKGTTFTVMLPLIQ
jgi:two-component system, NtrC family, nitrogen regulation sensor histidine kinase GlnL